MIINENWQNSIDRMKKRFTGYIVVILTTLLLGIYLGNNNIISLKRIAPEQVIAIALTNEQQLSDKKALESIVEAIEHRRNLSVLREALIVRLANGWYLGTQYARSALLRLFFNN
jgi:hypothetical protein